MMRRLVTLGTWGLWVVLGAVLALELAQWMDRQRERMTPQALTGTLLDKVNQALERR